jgi:hypothetical protein
MSTNLYLKVPLPFDIPTWGEHLNSKDPLAMVIRAHLYVEAILIRRIESVIVNKQLFDSARLQFSTKVKLAAALGKVDDADEPALNALNKLRNGFAHNLATQLQEQDERDFYNAFSKRQRSFVDHLRTQVDEQVDCMVRLRLDLVGLIIATNESTAPGAVPTG